MRWEDFAWGSGQDFSTLREFGAGENSQAKLSKSEVAIYSLKECAVHSSSVREPSSRSCQCAFTLAWRYPFLIASEGTRSEKTMLEFVPLAVWEENYFEEMQLTLTKPFLE